MSRTEETSQEERNKTIISSFIEEIFNEHNQSSIEKYFGKDPMEGSPQAGSQCTCLLYCFAHRNAAFTFA